MGATVLPNIAGATVLLWSAGATVLQQSPGIHCQKRLAIFPSPPAGMSQTKLSLAGII